MALPLNEFAQEVIDDLEESGLMEPGMSADALAEYYRFLAAQRLRHKRRHPDFSGELTRNLTRYLEVMHPLLNAPVFIQPVARHTVLFALDYQNCWQTIILKKEDGEEE